MSYHPPKSPLVQATERYWSYRKHVVYRVYDADGALLYVGMTSNAPLRFYDHKRVTPWWSDMRRIRLKVYPTRRDALDAERAAIKAERPLHNGSTYPGAGRRAQQAAA